jgi:hypothetical protein
MNGAITGMAMLAAVGAALRSTWSPCALSMLSTITPLTERGRGHRYPATAAWFVVGGIAGGMTLGAAGAGLAAVARVAHLTDRSGLAAAAVLAGLAALCDAGVFRARPPFLRRQVNEDWLTRYRPWVYGTGFGWQIGTGLTTYIMTTGVILTPALAVLTASPPAAFAVGTLFGLVRGAAVLLSSNLDGPSALFAFHRRLDSLAALSRTATVVLLSGLAVVGGALRWGVAGALLAAAAVAVPIGLTTARGAAKSHHLELS